MIGMNKTKTKVIALFAAATLVFGATVTPVSASNVLKTETVSSTLLKSSSDESTALGFLTAGLEGVASVEVPGLQFAVGPLLNLLFPQQNQTTQQLQKIEQNLQQIESSLTNISTQLDTLKKNISEGFNQVIAGTTQSSLSVPLNNLIVNLNDYEVYARDCANRMKQFDTMPDGSADKIAQEKKWLNDQYMKTNPVGKPIGYVAQELEQLLSDPMVSDLGSSDLFTTYDNYIRYTYKWEDQGYASRQTFREYILGTYMTITSVAEMSLEYAKENNLQNASATSPGQELLNLQQDVQNFNSIIQSEGTITERPSNQRYYQVPGHECLLANSTNIRQVDQMSSSMVNSIENNGFSIFINDWYYNIGGFDAQNFNLLKSYFTSHEYPAVYSNKSLGVVNTLPTSTWLNEVYQDYGSSKSLYDIFTSEGISIDQSNSNDDYLADPSVNFGSVENYVDGDGWLFHYTQPFSVNASIVTQNGNSSSHILTQGSCNYVAQSGEGYSDAAWSENFQNTPDTTSRWIGLAVLHQGVTPVGYDAESNASTPLATSYITVTNNAGPSDTVTVNNLDSGDTVKIYDAQADGNLLGAASTDNTDEVTASTTSITGKNLQASGMVATGNSLRLSTDANSGNLSGTLKIGNASATAAHKSITLSLPLASEGGSIYVTRTGMDRTESTRVRVDYPPETGTGSKNSSSTNSTAVPNPRTGNTSASNTLLWVPLALVAAGASGLSIRKKRRNKR